MGQWSRYNVIHHELQSPVFHLDNHGDDDGDDEDKATVEDNEDDLLACRKFMGSAVESHKHPQELRRHQ